ncbi:phage holin family protein [Gorillibacterium sp. sgz5001074]|uniref:phage holin family protein n=1 Tax=Gorillibacterium sp. sgz5001074 TaxID=3446695 RepID=UPI003F67B275
MDKYKAIWTVSGAVLMPMFEYFYGSGEAVRALMIALIFFIVLDWLSGISAAKKDNSYMSKYGLEAVGRTFFILLLPAGGHLLDAAFNIPGILFGAITVGILYHVLQSMTANAVRVGWGSWVPLTIMDWVIKRVGSELEKKIQRAEVRRDGAVNGKGV